MLTRQRSSLAGLEQTRVQPLQVERTKLRERGVAEDGERRGAERLPRSPHTSFGRTEPALRQPVGKVPAQGGRGAVGQRARHVALSAGKSKRFFRCPLR